MVTTTDQDDLVQRLQATADLIDGGERLADVSARAAALAQRRRCEHAHEPAANPFAELTAAADGLVIAGCSRELEALSFAFVAWAQSVEVRLFKTPTDALERAGAALAEKQPDVPETTAETCKRCKQPVKVKGRLRSCGTCSMSWKVPEKRAPLAQSPWVPDERPSSEPAAEWQSTYKDWLQERDDAVARADERDQYARRVRELEAEVERLNAVNATQVPADRNEAADNFVVSVRALFTGLDGDWSPADIIITLRIIRRQMRERMDDRIEFSVKEVLP